MDVKKFFADLAAMYRKPSEPTPQGAAAGIDAAHEVRLQAGYEAGHAEGTRPAMIRDIRRPKQRDANSAIKRAMTKASK
jgi:hypothetical protein